MPGIVQGKLLLGWMEETEAMAWLLKEYRGDKPFTEASARDLWQSYRDKVAALPERACIPPDCIGHRTAKERYEQERFRQKIRGNQNIVRVVKLDDPAKLVVHQLQITLPQSERYLADMQDPVKRVRICLGRGLDFTGTHPNARREGDRLIKPVPHAEFFVERVNQNDFQLKEGNRHIAVKEFDGRMLLSAGYHRAHISMYRSVPEDTVLPLFAALERDADGFFSVGTKLSFKRDMVRCARPPLLGDFLDESLCIVLPLRKCRVEIFVDPIKHEAGRLWLDAE